MKVRGLLLASLLLAIVMAVIAVLALQRLPDGARLITHWRADGTPNGSMPAARAVFFAPVIVTGLGLLFAALPRIEPLQDRLSGSAPLLRTAWVALLALMTLAFAKVVGPVYGLELPFPVMNAGVGLMLIALGNMLPKSRPGFFVGIRTPWTLTDTDNWIATHRLGAKTFIAAGLVMILGGMLPLSAALHARLLIGAALFSGGVPVVYSWWHWQSRQAHS